MEAFVYCWTDHLTNKLYIGSHAGAIDDGYVCSSKYMMEEYIKRPTDFTRQIIASGKTDDIRKLELKLLSTLNAAADESFYNRHNGFGEYLTDEIKQKIGAKSKQRWENSTDEKKQEFASRMAKVNKRPKTEEEKAAMRGKRPHVEQSGSKNNNARPIRTPHGSFGSLKEASDALGIAYDNIHYKLRAKHKGWEYA